VNIRAFANHQQRHEKTERKINGANGVRHNNVVPLKRVPNFSQWMQREIPPPDLLCGDFISTTARILITGPTGLGKTMLGIALAFAVEGGTPFLHWKAGRAARVLYVDGEMSAREMQRRLREEAERAGRIPQNLFPLSREDFEDMPPLNTAEGQEWMDGKIAETKPDLIIFDNIQALVVGDHCKEESWAPLLPFIRSLTKQHIGQIWFHHTGHNEGHSYGTKTRECLSEWRTWTT
jgi:RecA-family ATPase